MNGLVVELSQERPIPLEARFACAPGELLALVGPSGAGKSTILRCIAGLHMPEKGRISAGEEVWLDRAGGANMAAHRRRAGYVFQNYALFPHMTALENIMAVRNGEGEATNRERARELMALVHLAGLEDRRPAELSGGQQQRVAVARALAREPKVLLLDEPFSAVDKTTRQRLYQELAAMRRRLNMPILLVTHDLDEALMLADSLCLLHHGRILQQGDPQELLARPAGVRAAHLLGHRNIFRAGVKSHDEEGGVTLLDWNGRALEARHRPEWPPGAQVSWVIPAARVVLHRRDRPSRGEAENPVSGVIESHVMLGESSVSTALLDGPAGDRLTFHVPRHVADRNRLAAGERVSLSLLADAIHLMPPAGPRRGRSRRGGQT